MRRAALAWLVGLAALGIAWCAARTAAITAITLSDDRGETVSLARRATRIVTLSPHLAEIAFAAGAGDSIVGVSARTVREDLERARAAQGSHG